jgi:hypothetical protein
VVTSSPPLNGAPSENADWARWLATILRIHLLLQWDDLSDPAMKDALIEVATMRRIEGIGMISDRIPDETTNLTFRHLLEKHNHGEQIFEVVKARVCRRHLTKGRKGTGNEPGLQWQAVEPRLPMCMTPPQLLISCTVRKS